MDTSNWRPTQSASGTMGDPTMESGDWRAQLQADSRQRIVNKIMETLKRHLPFSGQEGLQELKKIAVRFEEKIYTAATSQSDYLRKISLKMLTMETRSQNPTAEPMQSNSTANSVNPSDPGSQVMQQVNNQGQQLPIPVPSNDMQQGQQMMSQNIHSNIGSTGMQGSSSLATALPPGSGLQQPTMANVAGQNSNLQNIQNMSSVQQNTVGNTMGSNNFANQRQIPGRPQLVPQQQQQQQSQTQNSHYLYQQQLHQMAKQKLQQPSMQPHLQQQQQQQNMLQPSHLQPSQQSVLQPTMMPTSSLSTVVQNQQPVVPQSSQPLMNHQQSVLRPQRQQQAQPIQQQLQSIQQNPMGQQTNATNMQQNQLIGQQNNYSDMQPQQQRLIGQQNKLSNLQQSQQQLIGQHNNLSSMQQQQPGQQQQLLGNQSGNTSMQTNQHSVQQILQSNKMPIQQQNQQNSANLLPQVQQSQPQLQQQVMPHMQSQTGQLQQQQQQVGMQQPPNLLQRDMQQRLPTTGGFQQQNMIDPQKQLFQQQRAMPEASSTSLDSTAQTSNPNGGDWQDEVYQKIKAMKDLYLLDLRPSHSASGAIRDPTMESGDWRAQVQAESRQKIANEIMGVLKKRLTIFSGNEGLQELQKIAEMLEERIYIFATSQSDYLREISLKMLAVETRSQDPMSDLMHPNSAANSDNPSDRGSEVMQQVNQGQLPIPVPSINIQQMMSQSQNMHSNVGLTGLQGSSSLSSTLPPGSGLQQPTFASVAGQNAKLQTKMSGVQQNQLIGQQYNHSHTHWQQLLKQQMPQPPMLQQQRMTGQQNKLSSRLQPSQQLIGQSTMTNVAGQYFDMQNIQNMPNVKQNQLLQQQRLRPTEGTSGAVGDLTMKSGDWRAQLQTDSRERITYQILDTLKRNLPSSGQEKLQELNNIAERVEKEIYTVATSQHEYSRKICFMMLSIQTRLQNPMSDPMGSNSAALYNIVKPSVPLDSIANGGDWLEEVYQKIKALKDLCTLDSTVHNPDGEDWQEEVYEKIKAMKDLYLFQLNGCYQKVVSILQQYDSLPQPKSFQQERLKVFKNMLESYMQFLQTPRHGISPDYKDKMTTYEKHIITIINSSRGRKAVAQQA